MFNWKLLFFIFLFYVLNNIGLSWVAYTYGYDSGTQDTQTKWDIATQKSNLDKTNTLEVQHEIENSAVDVTVSTRRLFNGSF